MLEEDSDLMTTEGVLMDERIHVILVDSLEWSRNVEGGMAHVLLSNSVCETVSKETTRTEVIQNSFETFMTQTVVGSKGDSSETYSL